MLNIYKNLNPKNFADVLGLQQTPASETTEEFLKSCLPEDLNPEDLTKHVYVLEKSRRKKTEITQRQKRRITAKEKRKFKLYDVQNEKLSYEQFTPLHELWMSYFKTLISSLKTHTNQYNLTNSLIKADYHGCYLAVVKSKCPSFVGKAGIMIKETKNSFICITRENKIKTLPKQNSVFCFRVDENLFTIHGNHFRVKTIDRSAKKFKSKSTVDL